MFSVALHDWLAQMNKSTLSKLLLSRSLYHFAKENAASANGIRLSIACNLLQDAVECFLLALSEHVNAGIAPRTDFDKYFEPINQKISPRELPFRLRLIALNKLRINSKHYGLEPAKAELEPLLTTVGEFFNEVTRNDFGKEFATISLLDILCDSESRDLLRQAESDYESHNYTQCLIHCREAIFVTFEWPYDAQPFTNDRDWFLSIGSRVPYFARNKKYIEENVCDPTDFVIYDHSAIEMELVKSGVDSTKYWNVQRLTPEVYRKDSLAPWIVKRDFSKLDSDGIKDRAEYVLLATTEMMLAADQYRSRTRSHVGRRFQLTLNRDTVPVYSKASKQSSIAQTTPTGMLQLYSNFWIEGFDGSGNFWHLSHWETDPRIYGYVHEDDVATKPRMLASGFS